MIPPEPTAPVVHSRQYVCGCVVVGSDPLPAVCPEHGERPRDEVKP